MRIHRDPLYYYENALIKWDKNKQLVKLDQSEASIVVDTEC